VATGTGHLNSIYWEKQFCPIARYAGIRG